jgi:hypothetical protein
MRLRPRVAEVAIDRPARGIARPGSPWPPTRRASRILGYRWPLRWRPGWANRRTIVTPEARTTAALVEAKRRGLIDQWIQ